MYKFFRYTQPRENGLFLKHFNSMLCNVFMLAVFVTFLFISGNEANAQQDPKINCDGTINCTGAEPWTDVNNQAYRHGNCLILPRFRYSKCCINNQCEYMVDLISIETIGTCDLQGYDLKKEALKFIMKRLPEIANIPRFRSYTLHVKAPKCMNETEVNFFGVDIVYRGACGEDCCKQTLEVLLYWDMFKIINQSSYQNTLVDCSITYGGSCVYNCNMLNFAPEIDLEIFTIESSVMEDICEADCFWRLDGNENIDINSFLGSTIAFPLQLKTTQSQPIIFSTTNNTAMTIHPNGQVGIGFDATQTNNSVRVSNDYLLGVKGKIQAEEVMVKLYGAWPDYVFSENYDLIPLKKLESLIKERGALPGIPTAEEMQKDETIPLGEMNIKLLQKIEEMTLYLIELEKGNHGLEQRLQKLEGK